MRPKEFWGISSYLSTAIATFAKVADMLDSCFDVIYDFVCLLDHFCTKTLNFMHFLQKRDIPTDRRIDRRTDRQTDTTSYRDARTHLKIMVTITMSVQFIFERVLIRGFQFWSY